MESNHVGFGNVPIIGKLEMWDEHACCMTATAQCMVVYMMCCFWSAMKPCASNLECRMAQNWCHQFFFFLFSSSSSICQQKQHHHASLQICLQLIHSWLQIHSESEVTNESAYLSLLFISSIWNANLSLFLMTWFGREFGKFDRRWNGTHP